MDEDHYRAVYREINPQRCVFEKAINNRRCDCRYKQHFLLATREGVSCCSSEGLQRCDTFLNQLREGSRFALREVMIDGPLPHNKELKVQAGGCHALQSVLRPDQSDTPDIYTLIDHGLTEYGSIDALPYSELVKGVLTYKSRRKARGGK